MFDNVERPAPLRIRHTAPTAPSPAIISTHRPYVAPTPAAPVEAPRPQLGNWSRSLSPVRLGSDKSNRQAHREDERVLQREMPQMAIQEGENLLRRSPERPNQPLQSQIRARPFFRPLPVKPSEPYAGQAQILTFRRPSEPVVPRRLSSLPSPTHSNFSTKPALQPAPRKPSITYSTAPAGTTQPSSSRARSRYGRTSTKPPPTQQHADPLRPSSIPLQLTAARRLPILLRGTVSLSGIGKPQRSCRPASVGSNAGTTR